MISKDIMFGFQKRNQRMIFILRPDPLGTHREPRAQVHSQPSRLFQEIKDWRREMIHCVKLKGGGGNSANPDRGGRDPDLLTRKRGWTESEKSWARGVTVSDDFAPLSRNGRGDKKEA